MIKLSDAQRKELLDSMLTYDFTRLDHMSIKNWTDGSYIVTDENNGKHWHARDIYSALCVLERRY